MGKRGKLRDGTEIEYDDCLRVISMSAAGALAFFGFSESTHKAIDAGPPHDPERWRPGARRWHVYRIEDLPS